MESEVSSLYSQPPLLLCDNLKNTVGKGGCYFSMFICLDGADGGEED